MGHKLTNRELIAEFLVCCGPPYTVNYPEPNIGMLLYPYSTDPVITVHAKLHAVRGLACLIEDYIELRKREAFDVPRRDGT